MAERGPSAKGFAAGRLRKLEYLVVLLAALFIVAAGLLSLLGGDALQRLAQIPLGTLAAMLALSLVNYGCRGVRCAPGQASGDAGVSGERG